WVSRVYERKIAPTGLPARLGSTEFRKGRSAHTRSAARSVQQHESARVAQRQARRARRRPTPISRTPLSRASEITPLWWTPRKGLFSSEANQCNKEDPDQTHSRETLFAV